MPELPEVEIVRRGLAPAMEGATITSVELRRDGLRFPFPDRFGARLAGRKILALGRRAKYLLADLDDGMVLTAHLGMSGSFRIEEDADAVLPGNFDHGRFAAAKHDHVVLHLVIGTRAARVTYNDPRRFGYMDLVARPALVDHPHFAGLGLEPLGNELDGGFIAARFAAKNTPIKAALLDQRIIAGLGNIYVCEALWRSGLSPLRTAASVAQNRRETRTLAIAIRQVLLDAIAAGGSTLRDHRQTDGQLGYFQHAFDAYGREGDPCHRASCAGIIERLVQSGRSTFHCPRCQR